MRNAARSGWELSRPEELIFELFRRPKGQARRNPCLASCSALASRRCRRRMGGAGKVTIHRPTVNPSFSASAVFGM
jgi:hypothetical protein